MGGKKSTPEHAAKEKASFELGSSACRVNGNGQIIATTRAVAFRRRATKGGKSGSP